ncbi:MAG: hypothetical protein M4579_001198 [Chaenotheca gracillima]|nr:MAG: hypothetical protein M4579_001198 [Chaenotheca gracillima]
MTAKGMGNDSRTLNNELVDTKAAEGWDKTPVKIIAVALAEFAGLTFGTTARAAWDIQYGYLDRSTIETEFISVGMIPVSGSVNTEFRPQLWVDELATGKMLGIS